MLGVNHEKPFSKLYCFSKSNIMEERQRIITVLIAVVIFNVVDRLFIHRGQGLTDTAVIISILIALVLYIALIYFFGKKHMN